MLVYRVEHKENGTGPFRCQHYAGDLMRDHITPHEAGAFTTPEDFEQFERMGASAHFGAKSLIKLDSFVGDWRRLYNRDFVVVVYEVSTYVTMTDGQVVFVRHSAKEIRRYETFTALNTMLVVKAFK